MSTFLRRAGLVLAWLAFFLAAAVMLSSLTRLFTWNGGY